MVAQLRTGDAFVITPKLDKGEAITGTSVSNTHIAAWTAKSWYLYSTDGKFLSKQQSELKMTVIDVSLDEEGKNYLIVKTNTEDDNDMALEVQDKSIEPFEFHSAIAIDRARAVLYTCIEISDNNVAVYKREDSVWKYDRTLGENLDAVFALKLSENEQYLIATIALGYKLWDLQTDKMRELKLPAGIRNIPAKNQLTSPLDFTKVGFDRAPLVKTLTSSTIKINESALYW